MVVTDAGAGPAEREFVRLTLKYSLIVRTIVLALSSLVSAITEGAPNTTAGPLVVAGLNAWNLAYTYLLVRRGLRWLIPVDVVLMCLVCLAQPWTTSVEAMNEGTGWVLTAVAIIVATYQWYTSPLVGILAGLLVTGCYVIGTELVEPTSWVEALPHGLWNVMTVLLARGLYVLVQRGHRDADVQLRRREQARQESTVAAARRADEREYLAALHDTASATLLMVGAGVAGRREPWLAEQAARDLQVISGQVDASEDEIDLVEMLRGVVELVPLRVEWLAAEQVRVPAVVGLAVSHGAREALTNVVRHAGVDRAEIAVYHDGAVVAVEIADQGRGFDPRQTPEHRYGVTRSIKARMTRLGGRATVLSRPGAGTVVRMEWPP